MSTSVGINKGIAPRKYSKPAIKGGDGVAEKVKQRASNDNAVELLQVLHLCSGNTHVVTWQPDNRQWHDEFWREQGPRHLLCVVSKRQRRQDRRGGASGWVSAARSAAVRSPSVSVAKKGTAYEALIRIQRQKWMVT